MKNNNHPVKDPDNLVNYTSSLSAASNEVYVPESESPNSLAFLIKNTMIIQDFLPDDQVNDEGAKGRPKKL